MPNTSSPSTDAENNSAIPQIIVLFAIVFFLGIWIVPNASHNSRELVSTFSSQADNLVSNPQIDESEAQVSNAQPLAIPVAMYNLENPNAWDTPRTVTLVGTFQSELGCSDDLLIECNITAMAYDTLGDIWQASFDLPIGDYEYRLHIDESVSLIYGKHGVSGIHSQPITFRLNAPQTVNFYYDHKTGWLTDNINSLIVTLPSNFQDEVGCKVEWNAGCFRTWMQDIEGDGIYTYETLHVPSGSWEARVALDGNLDTSYGQGGSFDGDNFPLWIPNIGHLSVFTWDSHLKTFTPFVSNVPIRLSTELPSLAPNE